MITVFHSKLRAFPLATRIGNNSSSDEKAEFIKNFDANYEMVAQVSVDCIESAIKLTNNNYHQWGACGNLTAIDGYKRSSGVGDVLIKDSEPNIAYMITAFGTEKLTLSKN